MGTAQMLSACLLALFAVAAATSGAAAPPPDAGPSPESAGTLAVADDRVAPGETTEASVTLSTVPDGLSGYNVTVRVADPETATIVDATVPERFGLREARVVDGGNAAVLKAVDTKDEVRPDDADVTFGSMTVRGEAAGETELRIEVTQVDDDDGGRVRPATMGGTLRVAAATTDPPTTTSDPGDPTAADPTTDDAPVTTDGETDPAGTTAGPDDPTEQPGNGPTPGLGVSAAVLGLAGLLAGLGLARQRRGESGE
jgi:hypothetical protein